MHLHMPHFGLHSLHYHGHMFDDVFYNRLLWALVIFAVGFVAFLLLTYSIGE